VRLQFTLHSTERGVWQESEVEVRHRHDHDAGGDAAVLAAKAGLREDVWANLAAPGVARFPGPDGRIPYFVGAEAAAERLRGLEQWQTATTIKVNPDSPQLPARQRALEDGKTVFMAVPRLAGEAPFLRLIHCRRGRRRNARAGIRWRELTDEKINAIPVLQRLRP
jgi:5-formyltetrahydrofolate cyclo-ligase